MKLLNYLNMCFKQLLDFIISKLGKGKHQVTIEKIGKKGESEVARELTKLGEDYVVLNDLYIPKSNGGTSQVDHLVISKHGIFVIETKNYGGYVVGNEEDLYWRHTNSKGSSSKMYSAIKQNEGHISALSKFLGIKERMFTSIIVFNGNVDITGIKSDKVVKTDRLVSKILEHKNLNVFNMSKIVSTLESIHTTEKDKREHVKNIKKQINSNYGYCSKCGNKLVLRNGNYGEFLGCSNYPKCDYTKNL